MEQDPIQKLSNILAAQERRHEPWTSGTVNLSGPDSTLFFKCMDGSSRHIQLGSTTDADIEALVGACQPASSGRGNKNVFDETYRKALKLDAGEFSWIFNPNSEHFLVELAHGFCPWDHAEGGIRLEPSKLNIYGEGGFFKAHKDTPRADSMFGSLVFVLPIDHIGGNLVLRHRGREFNFDPPSPVLNTPAVTVPYVAFYSDVEHEVLEVTSGNRITITFNIYFDPTRTFQFVPAPRTKLPGNPFSEALSAQLRDASFISSREYLGFGFEYTYPKRADEYEDNLVRYLKGPDAFLYRTLAELGLKPSLRYLYRSEYGSCDFWVMREYVISGRDQGEASSETELDYLLEDTKARIVWAKGKSEESTAGGDRAVYRRHPWFGTYFGDVEHYRSRTAQVDWVTEPSDNLVGMTKRVELGNEAAHEVYYYGVCILVDLGEVALPTLV